MSRKKRLTRTFILLGLNLTLLLFLMASALISPAMLNSQTVKTLPSEDAIIYGAGLEALRLEELHGVTNFKTICLAKQPQISASLKGKAGINLVNSADSVIKGANVSLNIPELNYSASFQEGSTGRYILGINESFTLSCLSKPGEVGADNLIFTVKKVLLNGKSPDTFSFIDFISRAGLSSKEQKRFNLSLDILVEGEVFTDANKPLANKTLNARLQLPGRNYAQDIKLTSDAQGLVSFRKSLLMNLTVQGGQAQPVSNAQNLGADQGHILFIDQNNISSRVVSSGPVIAGADDSILDWYDRKPKFNKNISETDKKNNANPYDKNAEDRADPINITTGNVYTSSRDISIPSRGLELKFERTYNSREDYSGPLGYGWTHNYNMRLVKLEDGGVNWMNEGGTLVHFSLNADGSYLAQKGEYSTLAKQAGSAFVIRQKNGSQLFFDGAGKLISIQDTNANAVTLAYDDKQRLMSATAPCGRKLSFTYDENSRISKVADPANNEFIYEYDANGDLVTVIDPQKGRTRYEYDKYYHLLGRIIDPNGHSNYFAYDDNFRAKSSSYEFDHDKSIYAYEANCTKITDSKGNRTEFYFTEIDGVRVITKIIDPQGKVEEFGWDENLNRTWAKDKNGRITRMSYDAKGNLLSVADALGSVTAFTYEPQFNRLTSATDAEGNFTQYEYDKNGNLILTTLPDKNTIGNDYDGFGQLLKATDARKNSTELTYDANGNLESKKGCLGNLTVFTYDHNSNLTKITDAKNHSTVFEYDKLNRLVKTIYPDLSFVEFSYDAAGNRIEVKDALGNKTASAYDFANRLVKTIDPAGAATQYAYDSEGNLTCVTDAKGNTTAFEYDSLNRLNAKIDANGRKAGYTYDAAGNKIAQTDANLNRITYEYDELNRLRRVNYPDGACVKFGYDKLSRRAEMEDAFGITGYTYDKMSRLLKVAGPGADNTIEYEYDANGNRVKVLDQDKNTTAYVYDKLNRLSQVSGPGNAVTAYAYDETGKLIRMSYPNNTTTAYGYDDASRLTNLALADPQGQALDSFTYKYDLAGRRTKLTRPEGEIQYSYDAASRLTRQASSLAHAAYNYEYEYDLAGNRLSVSSTGNKTIYTYNRLNQLTIQQRAGGRSLTVPVDIRGRVSDLTQAAVSVNGNAAKVENNTFSATLNLGDGSHDIVATATDVLGNFTTKQIRINVVDNEKIAYTYDNNGNLVKKQEGVDKVTTYTYDFENRLTRVTLNGEEIATYVYDGDGKRIRATEGGVTTCYFYDGLLPVIERNSSGQTTASYTRGLSSGGGIGGIISSLRGAAAGGDEAISYYHYDGLGNVTRLTDASGAVTDTYTYEAFGNIVSQTGSTANPYQFSTKHTNPQTGLTYFGARFYDPKVGRWITPDPAGMVDGPNLYAYCNNNPVNLVDYWGLCKSKLWKVITVEEKCVYPMVSPQAFSVGKWGAGETKFQLTKIQEIYKEFPTDWVLLDNKIIVEIHYEPHLYSTVVIRKITNEFIYGKPKN